MELLPQVLLLLGIAVVLILVFQRLHIPSTIAYLATGVILGPFTVGPILDQAQLSAVADYGIVFLLFTIGLSYSVPELKAMRHRLPLLGLGQVVLSTAAVGLGAWWLGVDPVAAFVLGAVFAQSSTTIISKQLVDQNEQHSRSGRLGVAMSVFQDVTAVPFVIVIPVLAVSTAPSMIAGELGWAALKVVVAIALVLVVGRWVLRPVLQVVARLRSAEVFTLATLFVVLVSAWASNLFGLSLAFGAFLAGMVLGESEFRHQVESTIRPFRDVLLGMFFVAIGMLFDPGALAQTWMWVLVGTAVLLGTKAVLVAVLVHASGADRRQAARTGLLLSVGGEFGLALVAIALSSGAIGDTVSQIALSSVLVSMAVGTFIIRYNRPIAHFLVRSTPSTKQDDTIQALTPSGSEGQLSDHVVLCGYGRIGQSVAHFLEAEKIPYLAVDLDVVRVREARGAGLPVSFGDGGDRHIIEALGVGRSRLVVIAHEDLDSAMRTLEFVRSHCPQVPVMVRTRDDTHEAQLIAAGAMAVVPETMEAGLSIASQALVLLEVDPDRVVELVREQRRNHYGLMREYFRGDEAQMADPADERYAVRTMVVPERRAKRRPRVTVDDIHNTGVSVIALLRGDDEPVEYDGATVVRPGDVVVAHGATEELAVAEALLRATQRRRESTVEE